MLVPYLAEIWFFIGLKITEIMVKKVEEAIAVDSFQSVHGFIIKMA